MKKILYILFVFAIAFNAAANDWGVATMPASEVKPGMTGTARTVFYGEHIEEFGVEIIRVMTDFYPGVDVILARLLGEKAEKNGVVSGMSGSPVYIDGKLVGAVAYRFGQFMKEPIAGIMPIETMFDILGKEKRRGVETSKRNGAVEDFMHAALVGADEAFWTRLLQPPGRETAAPNFRIISSPLVFAGFQPELLRPYESLFTGMGFTPTFSGGAGGSKTIKSSFEPGSAVSIVFLSGDLSIEATGTVTAVGDNKLLAFGHQLFNFGPIRLPLAGAEVYATLPSIMGSSKMTTATAIVGAFVQDRMSGALGDLTVQPKMIPVSLQIESPFHDRTSFSFNLADDPSFNNLLPFYLRIALIQAMNAARLAGELNSSYLNGAITLADGRKVELNDFFTSRQTFGFLASGQDLVSASDLVTVLLGALMVNDFASPQVAGVDLKVRTVPDAHYAMVESVWQDKTIVKPGDDLTLSVRLRDNKGKSQKITRQIHIPENIAGKRLTVIVSSGSSLSRYEMQVNRDKFVPRSFDHLLKILAKRRKSQNLYIQVRALDSGLIVDGEEMPGLPPSVLNVMNTRSSGGVSKRLRDRVIYEAAIPMQDVILGAKRLSLQIEQPVKATNNNKSRKTWFY